MSKRGEPTNVGCDRKVANRESCKVKYMEFIDREKYKNNIGIYLIKCLKNGKVYVGKTEYSFQERYWVHLCSLRKGIHFNKYLQRSWNKYGEEQFEFVVYRVCSKEDDITQIEIDTIKEFGGHTSDKNYNLTPGGDGVKGYIRPPEVSKHIGELNRQRMLGSHLSAETRKRMSEAGKGKKKERSPESKEKRRKYVEEKRKQNPNFCRPTEERKKELSLFFSNGNNNFAKLTVEDVENIEKDLMSGMSNKDISKKYHVGNYYTYSIIMHERWKYVAVDGWKEFSNEIVRKSHRKNKIYI